MSEETFIKTPKQLIWAVLLAFIVPIIVIILLVNFVASDKKPAAGADAFTAEATAERIAPVAKFELTPNNAAPEPAVAETTAPATAPEADAVAPAAPATAPVDAPVSVSVATPVTVADVGKALYEKACFACHVSGAAGAPKFGDKAAWAPRIGLGIDALTASVIKGKNAMPPRGTAVGASDAEIKAAVEYMVKAAK
jgi:cytochrome c5